MQVAAWMSAGGAAQRSSVVERWASRQAATYRLWSPEFDDVARALQVAAEQQQGRACRHATQTCWPRAYVHAMLARKRKRNAAPTTSAEQAVLLVRQSMQDRCICDAAVVCVLKLELTCALRYERRAYLTFACGGGGEMATRSKKRRCEDAVMRACGGSCAEVAAAGCVMCRRAV